MRKNLEQKSLGAKIGRAIGTAVALALVAGSVSPAMARGYGPYGYGRPGMSYPYPYRRYNRGMSAGDVIGIAALLGTVAVIASSASRSANNNPRPDYDRNYRTYPSQPDGPAYPPPPYPSQGNDGGYNSGSYNEGSYGNGAYNEGSSNGGSYNSGAMSSNQAVDACAVAVRNKVEGEQGGYAQIVNVLEPRATGQDSWAIDGRVERRSGYATGGGNAGGETRRFSCDVKNDRVAEVYISRDIG